MNFIVLKTVKYCNTLYKGKLQLMFFTVQFTSCNSRETILKSDAD